MVLGDESVVNTAAEFVTRFGWSIDEKKDISWEDLDVK